MWTPSSFLDLIDDALRDVEHRDVLLTQRNGPDVYLFTRQRKRAVGEGLSSAAAAALDSLLKDPQLVESVRRSIIESRAWVTWLTPDGQAEFVRRFVDTALARSTIADYAPLQQLLIEWKASAQIQHDPGLAPYCAPMIIRMTLCRSHPPRDDRPDRRPDVLLHRRSGRYDGRGGRPSSKSRIWS